MRYGQICLAQETRPLTLRSFFRLLKPSKPYLLAGSGFSWSSPQAWVWPGFEYQALTWRLGTPTEVSRGTAYFCYQCDVRSAGMHSSVVLKIMEFE